MLRILHLALVSIVLSPRLSKAEDASEDATHEPEDADDLWLLPPTLGSEAAAGSSDLRARERGVDDWGDIGPRPRGR